MMRFRNVKLAVFGQHQNAKATSKKKNMRQNRFKKLSKSQKFQLSDFILTWSNEEKVNSVWPDMTYSKELQQKNENVGQTFLKKHLNYKILVKYCLMTISRNSDRFLMRTARSLSQK